MKKSNIIFAGALSVAAVGASASNAFEMPIPFYGTHPTTGLCQIGTIDVGTCAPNNGALRCVVTFADGNQAVAYDDIESTTICAVPVTRPRQ